MRVKTGLASVDLAGPTGEAVCTFSRFGVVDHDGDWTLPGAIPSGVEVPVSAYQHTSWTGSLPVGRAVIHSDQVKAWAVVRFFMGTQAGRDTFEVVRELGELGQWSYGYDILDAEPGTAPDGSGRPVQFLKRLKLHEVSPVLVGAGIDTRTDSTKADALREFARFRALMAEQDGLDTSARAELRAMRASLASGGVQ